MERTDNRQETFGFAGQAIRGADWFAAQRLIAQVQREQSRHAVRSVASFLNLVDVVSAYEDSLIDGGGDIRNDTDFFRSMLPMLRGLGGTMLGLVRERGADKVLEPLGLQMQDFEAIVDEIKEKEAMYFPTATPERIGKAANQCFGIENAG